QKSEGLEGHRLSTSVWPGQNQSPSWRHPQIARHDLNARKTQERVACHTRIHYSSRSERNGLRVHFHGKERARAQEIRPHAYVECPAGFLCVRRQLEREIRQNERLLPLHVGFQEP